MAINANVSKSILRQHYNIMPYPDYNHFVVVSLSFSL